MNGNDIRVALFGASINPRLPVIDLHAAPDVHTAMEKFDREFDRLLRSGARAGRVTGRPRSRRRLRRLRFWPAPG